MFLIDERGVVRPHVPVFGERSRGPVGAIADPGAEERRADRRIVGGGFPGSPDGEERVVAANQRAELGAQLVVEDTGSGIPEELQVLGYPVLSIRSLPKERAWLSRYFDGADPLDINDVWPENFSANSVQKVWAARVAARCCAAAVVSIISADAVS